jgi:membrane-bound metal-dependent hydrolase YbcI (DUF457 family)
LAFRRTQLTQLTIALVAAVFALDLLWSLVASSTGSVAYGIVDVPAHLATCAIALLAIGAVTGSPPARRFLIAALVASVMIDVDHIPGYLGSQALTGSLPRPYAHTLLSIAVLLAIGLASRRRDIRMVVFGIAFGVSAHLLRDLATGPGVPLAWPLSNGVATVPYAYFAGLLALAVLVVLRGEPEISGRLLRAAGTVPLVVAVLALGHPASAVGSRLPPVASGAYIPGSGEDPSLIEAYGSEVGGQPVIVSSYKDWTTPLIDPAELDAVWDRGAVPMVTWEPWNQHDESQVFPLTAIAEGRYDGFVEEAAQAAAAWGHPILLRFAHEMNGSWYPWGRGRNGTTARVYKAAWRHLVSVFRASGASNVKWVWTPFVNNDGRYPFTAFYPGDRWVDWVGLDGFNWGTRGGWQWFGEIFSRSYHALARISSRPVIIAETGSSQHGGNKARWVSRALNRELPRLARIRALVWFSQPFNGVDVRVNSSRSALRALRHAIRAPMYRPDRDSLIHSPTRLHF